MPAFILQHSRCKIVAATDVGADGTYRAMRRSDAMAFRANEVLSAVVGKMKAGHLTSLKSAYDAVLREYGDGPLSPLRGTKYLIGYGKVPGRILVTE